MKPARFRYHRPHDLDAAVTLLSDLGDEGKVIAGGQSLLAMMNFRLARPAHLVDIGRIEGLRSIELSSTGLRIGALTTHYEVETSTAPAFDRDFTVLKQAMHWIGHLPIRTRGTVGGSIAHADATAEWCLMAMLLDAEVIVIGPQGVRTVAAADFFYGYYTTALDVDEIVTAINFPRPAPYAALVEFAERKGDFAIVAVAVSLTVEYEQVVAGRVAVAGASPVSRRVSSAEELLAQRPRPLDHDFADIAEAVFDAVDLPDDGVGRYKRQLARTLTHRAAAAAVQAGKA